MKRMTYLHWFKSPNDASVEIGSGPDAACLPRDVDRLKSEHPGLRCGKRPPIITDLWFDRTLRCIAGLSATKPWEIVVEQENDFGRGLRPGFEMLDRPSFLEKCNSYRTRGR